MTFKSLEAQREYMRQWRARNPDYQKKHYAKNVDKRRAEKRAAYAADPELWKERAKRYRDENPEGYRERKKRYRTENAAKENARIKKWNEENPDLADVQNAKRVLHQQVGIPIREIPRDLAEAKAEQLKITRWVREELKGRARDNGSRPEGENAERSGAAQGEARPNGSRSEIAQPPEATGEREGE